MAHCTAKNKPKCFKQPYFSAMATRARGSTFFSNFFCTERRLLWLARPGRKALARQAFFGEGREPEIKFNRGLSAAARCCPRLLHLKETWQPRYRQPQAGVSA